VRARGTGNSAINLVRGPKGFLYESGGAEDRMLTPEVMSGILTKYGVVKLTVYSVTLRQ